MLGDHRLFQNRNLQVVLLLFVLALSTLTGLRVYKNYSTPSLEFNWSTRGHSDFHNGTYLPTKAFVNGDNPYEKEVCQKYTMSRPAPLFSPFVFVMHSPLSLLSLHGADIAFFIYNVLLLTLVAYLSIRFCDSQVTAGLLLFLTTLLLLSRPGHMTLFTGYFTAELAIGTTLALHFARSKPWLAGVGLLLASGKPNFIIPLMILMACRRDVRAVLFGLFFCAIGAAAGFFWLASFSSPMEVIEGIKVGQAALHDDPTELPFNTWTRVDITGMVAKLMKANPGDAIYLSTMLAWLLIPGLALFRIGKDDYKYGATGLTGSIIALSILLSIYHQSYDALIMVAPWIGVTFFGPRVIPELGRWKRWVVALLMAVPAGNYLSSLMIRDKLGFQQEDTIWQGITLISGVCLLLALFLLLQVAFAKSNNESRKKGPPPIGDEPRK